MSLDVHVIDRPEPRRLQRHRRVQGRRPEPRRRRRRAPRRDLRRRHARQRLRLGDDPRHRPADAQGQHRATSCGSSGSAARSSACSARTTTSTTSARPSSARSATTSTPTSRRRRTTSLGVLDPAGVDLFGRTVGDDVPAERVRSRRRSRATTGSTTSTRSGRTTSSSRPSAPTRSSSTWPAFPASGVLTGQDCCKTQDGGRPVRRLRGQLRGQRPGRSTAAASTTRSAGATTSATTTRGADVHVAGVRQHGHPDGLRPTSPAARAQKTISP